MQVAFCDTHVKSKLTIAQSTGRKDPHKCKKCGWVFCQDQHAHLCQGKQNHSGHASGSYPNVYTSCAQLFSVLCLPYMGLGCLPRYELQESKMLSMSTRRHEYGRQTRDEAAEVTYTVARVFSHLLSGVLFAMRGFLKASLPDAFNPQVEEDLHACTSNAADTERHLTVVCCCTERMGLCSYQFRCGLHRRAGQSGTR